MNGSLWTAGQPSRGFLERENVSYDGRAGAGIHGYWPIGSEIALPGLIAHTADRGLPDVTIRREDEPVALPNADATGPTWQIGNKWFLLRIPDVARFLLSEGRNIAFEPEPSADQAGMLAQSLFQETRI